MRNCIKNKVSLDSIKSVLQPILVSLDTVQMLGISSKSKMGYFLLR